MAVDQPTCSCGKPETWKPVVGYEGSYEVSDHGRVRSVNREIIDKNGKKRSLRSVNLKGTAKDSGHLRVFLSKEGVETIYAIHYLVARTFIGPRPDGMPHIRHLDGNPRNNCLSNLKYGTSSENHFDAVRHGTHSKTRRTHCPRGHELAEWNNVAAHARRGYRTCLACNRAKARIRRYPEAGYELQELSNSYYQEIMKCEAS